MEAKHIIVYGRVQGVGFRWFVQRIGASLGLTGDVRNLPDSTVEVTVEGESKKIDEFIRQLSRGPSVARVDRLDVQDLVPSGRYRSFLIEGW